MLMVHGCVVASPRRHQFNISSYRHQERLIDVSWLAMQPTPHMSSPVEILQQLHRLMKHDGSQGIADGAMVKSMRLNDQATGSSKASTARSGPAQPPASAVGVLLLCFF